MSNRVLEAFCWSELEWLTDGELPDKEKYELTCRWAGEARGKNPLAFDGVVGWLIDDAQWTEDRLEENYWMLTEGLIGRFKKQTLKLQQGLLGLEDSVPVNEAVFPMIQRFLDELSGASKDFQSDVDRLMEGPKALLDRELRLRLAGDKTGPEGVNTVQRIGYINCLNECDASVQWPLFMPHVIESQQKGFKLENFEYRRLPAMRFIGFEGKEYEDIQLREKKMAQLDELKEYACDIKEDVLFMHHYGAGVDIGPWHGAWGRFMKPGSPVPEGFVAIDLLTDNTKHPGPPYVSQCAWAVFSGDREAMNAREGFDSDGMYDVTRNLMLSQGVCIPYPDKYWTAELFPEGCGQPGNVYLFAALLD